MKHQELFKYQIDAMRILTNSYKLDKLFHAYLLQGEKGTGLTDAALYMAKMIICKNDDKPCMNCADCKRIDTLSHLNLIYIKPVNDLIRKEQIESLIKDFSMTSLEVGSRVYIIEDADKMNASASNALLKFLEEPNPNHYAFLTTTSYHKLLDTIVSRCQVVNFKPVPKNYLMDKLLNCGVIKDMAYIVSHETADFDEAMKKIEEGKITNFYSIAKKIVIKDLKKKDSYIEYFRNKVLFQEEKDKNYHKLFLDILVLIYQEMLKKKTNNQIGYFEDIFTEVDFSLFTKEEIIRKLELLNIYQERFNYHINLDLQYTSLFSKL